jgi:hypothetical protein
MPNRFKTFVPHFFIRNVFRGRVYSTVVIAHGLFQRLMRRSMAAMVGSGNLGVCQFRGIVQRFPRKTHTTIYKLKHDMLSDYLRQELRSPSVRMAFA